MKRNVIAVDLGATSGRVMLATLDDNKLSLQLINRFSNQIKHEGKYKIWPLEQIESDIRSAVNDVLASAVSVESLGIDSWGVDYVCIDQQGQPVGLPISYRDTRTDKIKDEVELDLGIHFVYETTGIQPHAFNTLFQLKAQDLDNDYIRNEFDQLLLIPDFLNFRLTGQRYCERTNASTSQLLDKDTKDWNRSLLNYVNINPVQIPELVEPGITVGSFQGLKKALKVVTVASHDTASAVVATPMKSANDIYLISGTWSLIGWESKTPLVSQAAFNAGFSNEGGINQSFRILKNIMGMWLFEQARKELEIIDIHELAILANRAEPFTSLINVNHELFFNPDSMVTSLQAFCRATDQIIPVAPGDVVRCIYDSLVLEYVLTLKQIEQLRGQAIDRIVVVGGGCQNRMLNQLLADVSGKTIQTGPVEASALGNATVQLMANGAINSLAQAREIISHSFQSQTFVPNPTNDFDSTALLRRYQTIKYEMNKNEEPKVY